ncbi:Rpp14 family protein [Rutstroemia sp. NJR-2017a WRK4]|nr:Rpp14 family protein [Rutstroemia sp. NJR-2017a WRK4]
MVRIKNRYLLVNILYPGIDNSSATSKVKVPDVVVFHQPTEDTLTPQALLKGIKAEVANLFGDYGMGAIADSIAVKYLSTATSTFILRVSRAHYRVLWAALSLMNSVPVKNGKKCVFRVVRVSGTIRKAEEEAIRRARETILKARRELGEQSESTLEKMFGSNNKDTTTTSTKEVIMVDRSDSEEDEELSDGNG